MNNTSFVENGIIPTVANSEFVFYDIESLGNIFTLVTYDTRMHDIGVYYHLDNVNTNDPSVGVIHGEDVKAREALIIDKIRQANPARLNLVGREGREPSIHVENLADDASLKRMINALGGICGERGVHSYDNTRTDDLVFMFGGVDREYLQTICDTHQDYNPAHHPFIMGYNSYNYDTTILALYLAERLFEVNEQNISFADRENILAQPNPFFGRQSRNIEASTMRAHNDNMFSTEFKKNMSRYLTDRNIGNTSIRELAATFRYNMLSSGRHVDIARLNETQSKVALKRLLGQMGHQILESDRLSGVNAKVESYDDIFDLLAYNVSDVIGTELLFREFAYTSSFDLRSALMRTYPEVVFNEDKRNPGKPLIMRNNVKGWRHRVDTSSAQFAGSILAPYTPLREISGYNADTPVVSLRYPDAKIAEKTGRKQVNVLTDTRDFILDNVTDKTALNQFKAVYEYYRSIEGMNFNNTNSTLLPMVRNIRFYLNSKDENLAIQFNAMFNQEQDGRGLESSKTTNSRSETISYFTINEMNELLDEITSVVNGDDNTNRDNILKAIDYLRVYYRAKADSQLTFDPAEDPAEGEDIVSYPPKNLNQPQLDQGLSAVARPELNIPYIGSDGQPNGCFATFSTGGIHGAEYNSELHAADNATFAKEMAWINTVTASALDQYRDTCVRVDTARESGDTSQLGKKDIEIVDGARQWAQSAQSREGVEEHDGFTFEELAQAAWFIRQNVRITVTDPESAKDIVVHHSDVLKAGKKQTPVMRTTPVGLRPAHLFKAKRTTTTPAFPEGGKHVENVLNPKYNYTSVADVIHEDFTSYYPRMLTNMAAFENPELADGSGESVDRYSVLFDQKEEYGKKMKDPANSPEQRQLIGLLREGVKLILNSASGAADAKHPTQILMNNVIIAMRVIGQLYTFRVGAAQSLADGHIVSTNTDGLYSTLDPETNNRILAEQTEAIGVEIEPEELTLVSKDANNRAEFHTAEKSAEIIAAKTGRNVDDIKPWERVLISASGGTLACANGPDPKKSLSHAAITDFAMVEYFKYIVGDFVPEENGMTAEPGYENQALSIDQPMNEDVLRQLIIPSLHAQFEPTKVLTFYQNILASSPSSDTYIFTADFKRNEDGEVISATDTKRLDYDQPKRPEPVIMAKVNTLQHYNRSFYVDPEKAKSNNIENIVVIANARARVINQATKDNRARKGESPRNVEPAAKYVLEESNVNLDDPQIETKDIMISRKTGVDPQAPMVIVNEALIGNPDETFITRLIDSLDMDAYVDMIRQGYTQNWQNITPDADTTDDDIHGEDIDGETTHGED